MCVCDNSSLKSTYLKKNPKYYTVFVNHIPPVVHQISRLVHPLSAALYTLTYILPLFEGLELWLQKKYLHLNAISLRFSILSFGFVVCACACTYVCKQTNKQN